MKVYCCINHVYVQVGWCTDPQQWIEGTANTSYTYRIENTIFRFSKMRGNWILDPYTVLR